MKTSLFTTSASLLLALGLFQGPMAHSYDKMTSDDKTLVKQIRQDLANDSSLPTDAQRINIVAINGTITLKGIVRSDQERSTIYNKVAAESGVSGVDNKLEVRTASNSDSTVERLSPDYRQ